MPDFAHKKLIKEITNCDQAPSDSESFARWVKAEAHLELMRRNPRFDDRFDEIAIYVSAKHTFVHSVVVRNDALEPVDQDDLLRWNFNPFKSIASLVAGGGRDDVWVKRGLSGTGTATLEGAVQLIFGRTFDGWTGQGRTYFELHQEYAHLTGIHWRPEHRAFCCFNEHGDLEPVVSMTTREDNGSSIALVSFKWKPLEEYLAACDASLVRMFDFTLLRSSDFSTWADGPESHVNESADFFYRQRIMPGHAGYARGVQIIRPRRLRRPRQAVFTSTTEGSFEREDKQYVEFIAWDWRNKRVTKISTDPSSTTNYFEAEENELPFELSPAFFRPEVLSKYKADRDKYTVNERSVLSRAGWYLKSIDVNEAGQVHAYICYLRQLPYTEQLHWLSFNEPPKTGVSKRAVISDFQGKCETVVQPLPRVLLILERWHSDKVVWWTLRDGKLLGRVNMPLTGSRDEWAEAFMDLAKLVVEGFKTKAIRARLDAAQVPYDDDDKTIALLEKLLNKAGTPEEAKKLDGLRTVQLLRTKLKGHVGGSEAEQLSHDALREHETFANHFRHVCVQVADDLEIIERLFSQNES